jgi:opacity protein-like surface antigen
MKVFVRTVVVVLAIAAVWAVAPVAADAQNFAMTSPGGRAGQWEFILPLIYSESAKIDGANGSKVDINSDWGMGLGFGYNVNDNFQVNGLFTWSYRSYQAMVTGNTSTLVAPNGKYSNYMDASTLSLNAVYYFLGGNVTPFVSGGVGITYVDTNIQTGPGQSYCWYDPWWGYVCGGYVPTKTENDLSYNAGVGLRIDLNRQFSLQGSFNRMWIDFGGATKMPFFDTWRTDLIFRM